MYGRKVMLLSGCSFESDFIISKVDYGVIFGWFCIMVDGR